MIQTASPLGSHCQLECKVIWQIPEMAFKGHNAVLLQRAAVRTRARQDDEADPLERVDVVVKPRGFSEGRERSWDGVSQIHARTCCEGLNVRIRERGERRERP